MKRIDDYNNIIFLGGGVMADRLYRQIPGIEDKLIGVIDLYEPQNRKVKEFHNIEIHSPLFYDEIIRRGETAIVIAVGCIEVNHIVEGYIKQYPNHKEYVFVVNPYSCLRFFYVDKELSEEQRIPFTDIRYRNIERMFKDELSIRLFQLLCSSKPYESKEDTYELLPYEQIKDWYYYEEDYWCTYEFYHRQNRATVLDCGAYIGDSVIPICKSIPAEEIYYYALEPFPDSARQMIQNEELKKVCQEFHVLEVGAGKDDVKMKFCVPENGDAEGGRFVETEEESENCLTVRRLDGLDLDVKGQLYIKMDIEGSELDALTGAENLIRQYRPYLAICLYHRKNDLLNIPLYIQSLVPDYDFYLRGGYHTILWAIPKE